MINKPQQASSATKDNPGTTAALIHHTNDNDLCEAHCQGCAGRLRDMAACWLDPKGFSGLAKRSFT